MPSILKLRKSMLLMTTALAGGTMFADGCMNLALSVPVCGTILTFCTPNDQLALTFPLMETPDFSGDPSCTIPLACGDTDLNGNSPIFPNSTGSEQPEDEEQGLGSPAGGGV